VQSKYPVVDIRIGADAAINDISKVQSIAQIAFNVESSRELLMMTASLTSAICLKLWS
jgi:hypothetical protein